MTALARHLDSSHSHKGIAKLSNYLIIDSTFKQRASYVVVAILEQTALHSVELMNVMMLW